MNDPRPTPPLRTARAAPAGMRAVALLALALALLPAGAGAQYARPPAPQRTEGQSAPQMAPQVAPQPAPQAAQQPAETPAPSADAESALMRIQGDYDIEELRRLIELARESGFSEEQIRQMTVEDEQGNVVSAWEFLKAYDERKRREAARIAAQNAKVYLSPKDILNELDKKQPEDLDKLRERMLFVE